MKKYTNMLKLLRDFTELRITASEFDKLYLEVLRKLTPLTEKEYNILQELFYDTEEYCDDPSLREPGEIDEKGLLESAKKTLEKLKELGIE